MGSFCVHCGSKLDLESKFCTNCGQAVKGAEADKNSGLAVPIEASTAVDPSAPTEEMRSVDLPTPTESINQGEYPAPSEAPVYAAPSTSTMQMPPIPPQTSFASIASPTQQNSYSVSPATERKKTPVAIIVLVAIVALLAIALGVVLAITQPWNTKEIESESLTIQQDTKTNPIEEKEEVTPEEEVPESEDDKTSAADESSFVDEDTYQVLLAYYDALARYEQRVKECASDFNENYLKEDFSIRSANAEECFALLEEMMSDYSELIRRGENIPSSSKYNAAYKDIDTLYYCLTNRVSVICQAWNICLNYAVPADHQEEITAPIARDNVSGVNKYKTQYEELYPKARPEKQ